MGFIFLGFKIEIQQNGLTNKFYYLLAKDSKKLNVLETHTLELLVGGGGAQGLHSIASFHVFRYVLTKEDHTEPSGLIRNARYINHIISYRRIHEKGSGDVVSSVG